MIQSDVAELEPAPIPVQLSESPRPPSKLGSIQVGRGIAALIVLLYHNSITFSFPKYWGHDPLQGFAKFGHAGVEFFFVLSGFLIYFIHNRDIGKPARLTRYIRKRFIRIYPVYWIVLTALLPVYFLVAGYGEGWEREPLTILSSFLLVHIFTTHVVLPVSWTLFFELRFYAAFALLIFNRKLGMFAVGLWLLLSVLSLPLGFEGELGRSYFSPANLLFAMGIASAWLLNRRTIPVPSLLLLLGIFIFLATGLTEVFDIPLHKVFRNWLYGLGSAFAILGAVELERNGLLRAPSIMVLAGEASYSIYLLHAPMLSIAVKILIGLGIRTALPAVISYFLIVALVTTLCVLFHLYVERPLLKYCEAKLGVAPSVKAREEPSVEQTGAAPRSASDA